MKASSLLENHSPSVDLAQAAIVGKEYHDTKDPEKTELSSRPQATNSVTENECECSPSDAADLYHGGYVAFDARISHFVYVFVQSEQPLEIGGIECSCELCQQREQRSDERMAYQRSDPRQRLGQRP